jgi:hypothetical protein
MSFKEFREQAAQEHYDQHSNEVQTASLNEAADLERFFERFNH